MYIYILFFRNVNIIILYKIFLLQLSVFQIILKNKGIIILR